MEKIDSVPQSSPSSPHHHFKGFVYRRSRTMENTDVIAQKILHLKDLVDKPDRNKGSVLRLFHDLFQLTHEGRDLSPEDAEWLSETARLFLSPELSKVLFKLHLDVYGFFFAALSFVDIDDVVDDLANGDVLKNSKSFPPGVYNKLKRELLGSATNLIRSNVQSKPTREEAPVSPFEIELGKSDVEQVEVKERDGGSDFHLLCTSLIKNLSAGNKGGVMESLQKLVHHNQFSIDSFEFKDALKQSAALLLSTEVSELFEKLYLGEYSYLLAANYITDINALMDDISNVGALKTILPTGAFRNLKREMSTKMSNNATEASPNLQLVAGMQILPLSPPTYGEASALPPNISKPQRLALELLPLCSSLGKNKNGIEMYQLPLDYKGSSKTERWVFGKRGRTNVDCKTILLMGATGSGKTTLINAMVNFILGVEWGDPFRFSLISEEGTSSLPNSQAYSQTSKVTAYEIRHQEGSRVSYSLIIVDTPGYGDTKGIDRDHRITDCIQQFFKDEKGIQMLDAVGFTVQAALARLTPTQKYIFDSILAIFGKDVRDNIRFLVTFTDGQTPPVLEAIKEANITHQFDPNGQPRHHRFNNSGFFTSNQIEGDTDFGSMFWKLGMKNFESFFSGLSTMMTRSLTLTKEVLEERKHINVTIEGLTVKINNQLTKMEELRKTKQVFENYSDQINANKDFKYTVTVSRGDRIEITDGKCTTNCSKCSMSCHFPCGLAITDDKQRCAAMDKKGFCESCPMKCKWDMHVNQNYHWVFQNVTETRTYDDIKQKYEEAVQEKLSTEEVLQHLGSELDQIKFDLKRDIETITEKLQRLDVIALRPNAFTSTDYIELMIQAEGKKKKAGFEDRIRSLNSLLDNARVVQKIRAGESIFPEAEAAAGQSCSQTTVTIQPQALVKKPALWDRVKPW